MNREVITTQDGSSSIFMPELNVSYHSKYGAITESKHVFLQEGYDFMQSVFPQEEDYRIFEMGLGTGLNAYLTAIEAAHRRQHVRYVSVEAEPLQGDELKSLNYIETLPREEWWDAIHKAPWNVEVKIHQYFTLHKIWRKLQECELRESFHLVYYDAFAPAAQPELWTKEIFSRLLQMLSINGILVTYCSKGDVQRAMKVAGFTIEKLKGPPGKREMLRARRPG